MQLHIAGDIGLGGSLDKIPAVACALVSVTFERFMGNDAAISHILAGSTNSLKRFEAWSMGTGKLFKVLVPHPVLHAFEVKLMSRAKDRFGSPVCSG